MDGWVSTAAPPRQRQYAVERTFRHSPKIRTHRNARKKRGRPLHSTNGTLLLLVTGGQRRQQRDLLIHCVTHGCSLWALAGRQARNKTWPPRRRSLSKFIRVATSPAHIDEPTGKQSLMGGWKISQPQSYRAIASQKSRR